MVELLLAISAPTHLAASWLSSFEDQDAKVARLPLIAGLCSMMKSSPEFDETTRCLAYRASDSSAKFVMYQRSGHLCVEAGAVVLLYAAWPAAARQRELCVTFSSDFT